MVQLRRDVCEPFSLALHPCLIPHPVSGTRIPLQQCGLDYLHHSQQGSLQEMPIPRNHCFCDLEISMSLTYQ
jgi:hypothetical protein